MCAQFSIIGKTILFSPAKNQWLKRFRGVCFEEVITRLHQEGEYVITANPNQERYPGQRYFVMLLKGYPHCVPFDEEEDRVRLITIYPNRYYKSLLGDTRES